MARDEGREREREGGVFRPTRLERYLNEEESILGIPEGFSVVSPDSREVREGFVLSFVV